MNFEVEECPHGVIVRGPVSIDYLNSLHSTWKKHGWTLLHAGIASALGATFAVTNKKHEAAWLAELDEAARAGSAEDPELEWLLGRDTGTSSLTIFSVLSRQHATAALARLAPFGPCEPLDPDDFGRCHRLLERFPGWRERLLEVAAKHRTWSKLVEHWDRIAALYLEELPTGRAPRCYDLISRCRRRRAEGQQ